MPDHQPSARAIAARAIADAAVHFPDLLPRSLETASLESRDARLALAIHRCTMQRWLTIEHLLNRFLKKPVEQLEPRMQGVLLTAGAQLLFMDRLPTHSIVDESVKVAKQLVREGAAGMTNAVLRKLSDIADAPVLQSTWAPHANRIPFEDGFIPLCDHMIPKAENISEHLRVVTSHPKHVVNRWIRRFGRETTIDICHHGVMTPPTIIAVEAGFDPTTVDETEQHAQDSFVVWSGSHDELVEFLAGHPDRRVQDPASSEPIDAIATLSPKVIVDYCAGRGTKTRQLAATFPNARIIATDTDGVRRESLAESFAESEQVTVIHPDSLLDEVPEHSVDLVVLDVPCSNTGVLARRPEARFRFSSRSLESLIEIQRDIVEYAMPLLAPQGHLLYSTCSLEVEENSHQHAWMIDDMTLRLTDIKGLVTPKGEGKSFHDGGEYALLQNTA